MAKETHILVVDDEPKICEFLGILLGREGYRTDSAYNAADALAQIEQNSYDLVLTDLKMPGMDGFELITRLKKIRPDLPVIMITGYATVETAVQALRYGVDDYVTKPFNIDELRKVIARSLQSATAQQQSHELVTQLQAAGGALPQARGRAMRLGHPDARGQGGSQGQIHGRPFAARGGIRLCAGECLRRLAG
jgi:DNA-binding NtrC family response regulator